MAKKPLPAQNASTIETIPTEATPKQAPFRNVPLSKAPNTNQHHFNGAPPPVISSKPEIESTTSKTTTATVESSTIVQTTTVTTFSLAKQKPKEEEKKEKEILSSEDLPSANVFLLEAGEPKEKLTTVSVLLTGKGIGKRTVK